MEDEFDELKEKWSDSDDMDEKEDIKKPSKFWYLLPIFFSIIGGIIGYFLFKNKDRKFAHRLLIVGVIMIGVFWVAQFLLADFVYMYLGSIMQSKISLILDFIDVSCRNGVITTIIKNEGVSNVTVSYIEFFLNGQKTIPSGCSGYIEPASVLTCNLGSGLSGNQNIEIKYPSKTVSKSVSC